MALKDLSTFEKLLAVLVGGWVLIGWLFGPTTYMLPFLALFVIWGGIAFMGRIEKWWTSRRSTRRTRA